MRHRSRILDQENRISELAQRIEADAQGVLRAYRATGEWAEPFVRLAAWLVTAAAAGVMALLFVPPPPEPEPEGGSIVERSIGPTDLAGANFVLSTEPPPGPSLFGMEEQ